METQCCVCGTELESDAPQVNGRRFCPKHHLKIHQNRRSVWWSTFAGIGSTVAFVLLAALLQAAVPLRFEGIGAVAAAIILAAVPALVWLVVFYRLDALEPEPKGALASVFVLGALVAGGLGIPVLEGVFRVQDWLTGNPDAGVRLLGSILVIGLVQEFLKYAAVRYSLYPQAEFDERTDGVVYGAMAGLGFAFALNLETLLSSEAIDPLAALLVISVTTVGQASFSGISGYFLGVNKFQKTPVWWMGLGLVLAASANGLVQFLAREVSRQGVAYTPGWGLVLAGGFALAVFGCLFYQVRKTTTQDLAQGGRA